MKKTIGFVACVLLAVGCGTSPDAPPSAAVPSNAPPGSTPPGDKKDEKKEANELSGTPTESDLTERLGVFVKTAGSNEGDGTRAKPFATIAKGIEAGRAAGKRVYVCEGTYKESLVLEETISVVGGLDCAESEWKVSNKPSVLAAPSSPAIRASDIKKPTRLEGFEINAPDATEPSGSSIGLLASNASGLTVARSRITSGNGARGADGTSQADVVDSGAGANGLPERRYKDAHPLAFTQGIYTKEDGAPGGVSSCGGGPGGKGGSGGLFTSTEFQVVFSSYWLWLPTTEVSGPEAGGPGSAAPGAAGVDGASGSAGVLDANGYKPADGTPGTNGGAGSGGAGGKGVGPSRAADSVAGEIWLGIGGAGGGAGGCPGLAGTTGKGGGASIGALLVNSVVLFDHVEVRAGNGGAGGRGSFGRRPTAGSPGGTSNGGETDGAHGGAGGLAGVSGAGGGGPSFAIAHSGGAPKLQASSAKAGSGGAGVSAEMRTDGTEFQIVQKTIPASSDGRAEDVHPF